MNLNWLDKLIPLIAAGLGFFFGRLGQSSDARKNDKKKLKKLLFNLLELKYQIERTLNTAEKADDIASGILGDSHVKQVSKPEDDPEIRKQMQQMASIEDFKKIDSALLEERIEAIIQEMAEIDPVFAYELTGKYKVSEKIANVNFALTTVLPETPEVASFRDIIANEVLKPILLDELLAELVSHIRQIAKKIGRKTLHDIEKTLKPVDIEAEKAKMQVTIGKVMSTVITKAAGFQQQLSKNESPS